MFIWTISDAISIAVFLIVCIAFLVAFLIDTIENFFCKHKKFYVNIQGGMICKKCGKNLGAYDKWIEKSKG